MQEDPLRQEIDELLDRRVVADGVEKLVFLWKRRSGSRGRPLQSLRIRRSLLKEGLGKLRKNSIPSFFTIPAGLRQCTWQRMSDQVLTSAIYWSLSAVGINEYASAYLTLCGFSWRASLLLFNVLFDSRHIF